MAETGVGRLRAFLVTLLGCSAVFFPSGSDAAERQLIAVGELTAVVDNDPGWCRSTVDVIVRSPTLAPFKRDQAELKRFVERIRLALAAECPSATAMRVSGVGHGMHVFEGTAAAENNWVLVRGPNPDPRRGTPSFSASRSDPVAECDALAAHRDDPQKMGAVAGVEDRGIDINRAIEACGQAVKAEPKVARLWFQLGRAYWTANRFEEAIETFVESGRMGHGGALAYLGDAALYGVAGLEPNPETAKRLYERAAKAGFKPAAGLAAEIVAGVESAAPEPEYGYPTAIKALMTGNTAWTQFGLLAEPPITILYVLWALHGVSDHCPNLVPKDFERRAQAALDRAMKQLRLSDHSTLERNTERGAYHRMVQRALDDGYAVASTKGCGAKETQTLVATGLRHF